MTIERPRARRPRVLAVAATLAVSGAIVRGRDLTSDVNLRADAVVVGWTRSFTFDVIDQAARVTLGRTVLTEKR